MSTETVNEVLAVMRIASPQLAGFADRIAAARPSAADEPVAMVPDGSMTVEACVAGVMDLFPGADRQALTVLARLLTKRPASARPSAGVEAQPVAKVRRVGKTNEYSVLVLDEEAFADSVPREVYLRPAPVAPAAEGWVLVPREPTPAMLMAAGGAVHAATYWAPAYRAMLAAVLNPPLPPHLRGSPGEGVTTAAESPAQPEATP